MRKPTRIALAAGVGIVAAGSLAVAAGAVPLADDKSDGKRPAADGSAAERPQIHEDFNGDGYNDIVIGAPDGEDGLGYLTVVYGSAEGLDLSTTTTIGQVSDEDDEFREGFGHRLLAEDLDGDGVTDLVVRTQSSSKVVALWGAEDRGLSADDSVELGKSDQLTSGDFDGDGERDLVLTPHMAAEKSELLRGPFTRDGQPAERQNTDLSDPSGFVDVFELAAGDVTGDGADDLVLLQSMEEGGRKGQFFTGGSDGLTRQDTEIPMGLSATIGDFDGDGHGDLAYREAEGGIVEGPWTDAGTVHVHYGSKSGFGDRKATFTQATPGVPGAHEKGDMFGAALSAGDVNGDGFDDLAVGVPGEAIEDKAKAGAVVLLKGSAEGLTGAGAQAFSQDTAGVPGVAEAGDFMGAGVRLLDVNNDGMADLTASAPGENGYDGAAWSFRGTSSGVSTSDGISFAPGDIGADPTEATFGAVFSNSTANILWGIEDR